MNENSSSRYSEKPKVLLLSDSVILTNKLTEQLLSNRVEVFVFRLLDEDNLDFNKNKKVNYVDHETVGVNKYDYEIFVCLTDYGLEKIVPKTFGLSEVLDNSYTKSVYVFPFDNTGEENKKIIHWSKEVQKRNQFAAILYIGDIISFSKDGIFGKTVEEGRELPKQLVIKEKLGCVHPITTDIAVGEIIRHTLSLKAYGKKTAIHSKPIIQRDISDFFTHQLSKFTLIKEHLGEVYQYDVDEKVLVEIDSQKEIVKFFTAPDIQKYLTTTNLDSKDATVPIKRDLQNTELKRLVVPLTFGEVFENKSNSVTRERNKEDKNTTYPKVANKTKFLKKIKTYFAKINIKRSELIKLNTSKHVLIPKKFYINSLFALSVFLIFIPVLILLTNITTLFVAERFFESGRLNNASRFADIAYKSANLGKNNAALLSGIPIIGDLYGDYYKLESTFIGLSTTQKHLFTLNEKLLKVVRSLFDSKDFQSLSLLLKLPVDFETLYNELGFVVGDLETLPTFSKSMVSSVVTIDELKTDRWKILKLKQLSGYLPELLGIGKPTNYLILFENNLVARPTGGKLEKVGVITFSNGKLIDAKTFSVDEIDSGLKGESAAPEPLQTHFDRSEWKLEDYNWEPDFVIAAEQVAWFLDKSLDMTFDGIVSVNLEFLKQLYPETNALILNENTVLNANNFYEQVDKEFKEGRSDAFFNSLAEKSLGQLPRLEDKELEHLVSVLSKSLEEKNIQIALSNKSFAPVVAELDWDGGLSMKECGNNCYSDYVAIVESENETTSGAKTIYREAELSVSLEEGLIKRKLTFLLDNTENQLKYKEYVRVLIPGDAGLESIEVITKDKKEIVEPEIYGFGGFKEAGIYIKLEAGESKVLVFNWESGTAVNFNETGRYVNVIRKQPGLKSYPASIKVSVPKSLMAKDTRSLTWQGMYSYNTALSKDFMEIFNW